jgi:uncharacterized membrane protein
MDMGMSIWSLILILILILSSSSPAIMLFRKRGDDRRRNSRGKLFEPDSRKGRGVLHESKASPLRNTDDEVLIETTLSISGEEFVDQWLFILEVYFITVLSRLRS